jgi:hypothetical protein
VPAVTSTKRNIAINRCGESIERISLPPAQSNRTTKGTTVCWKTGIGDRPERWPNIGHAGQTLSNELSQAPQLLRAFGLSKDIVVKKKVFEYGLDNRLS